VARRIGEASPVNWAQSTDSRLAPYRKRLAKLQQRQEKIESAYRQ
jgi:hypothetical protein